MKRKSDYLPVALKVAGKKLLIVGGGEVAYRKFIQWQDRGANITVVASEFCVHFEHVEEVFEWVSLLLRPFKAEDLAACDLVYIATNNSVINAEIEALCQSHRIWCARADQAESDFQSLSLIEHGPIQIAIGTSGQAPSVALLIKEDIENEFDWEFLERKIELMAALKQKLKQDVVDQSHRRALLGHALGLTIDELERLMTDETFYSGYKRQ